MCQRCEELEKKLRQKDKALTRKHKNILDLMRQNDIVRRRSREEVDRLVRKNIELDRMLYDIREVVHNDEARQLNELWDRRGAMSEAIELLQEHIGNGNYHGYYAEVLRILKDAEKNKGREPGWGIKDYHNPKPGMAGRTVFK